MNASNVSQLSSFNGEKEGMVSPPCPEAITSVVDQVRTNTHTISQQLWSSWIIFRNEKIDRNYVELWELKADWCFNYFSYFDKFWPVLATKNFFCLPFWVYHTNQPEKYFYFLSDLSRFLDDQEIPREEQEELKHIAQKYLYILIEHVNYDKISFLHNCFVNAPDFMKEIFVCSEIKNSN